MSFFAELRRRNVIRVGAAYVVIAWVIAQVAEFAFDNFGAPDWALKSLVVVLLLGSPIALLFAWAFELTPEGVKREKDVDRNASITANTGRKLDFLIIASLILVGILVVARPYLPGATPQVDADSPVATVNSIAVLPFADLSENRDQEYFADGISEEILNVLVRIAGLKVAGRTSSFSFKGRNEDLREISTALGVNHVLEGSVRRSGDKLRITAQLIRGEDGFHLWSETFDRNMADIFSIQDEIARAVADQLAVSLGLSSESLVQERTDDLVAYENVLRARQLFDQRGKENLDQALLLLSEATARDPDFAPGWEMIAAVYSVYASYTDLATGAAHQRQWHAIGRAAAERAITLNPDNGLAHGYLGEYLQSEGQWTEAMERFDYALKLAPDSAVLHNFFAQQLGEAGYLKEAEVHARRAIDLDPLVAMNWSILGVRLHFQGKFEAAIEQYKRSISLNENNPVPYWFLANIHLRRDEFVAAADVIEKACEARAFSEPNRLPTLAFAKILRRANSREDVLLAATELTQNGAVNEFALRLRDASEAIPIMVRNHWEAEYRRHLEVFGEIGTLSVMNHPRWKEQVRRDGILELWRARGFPSQCTPAEGDDFNCEIIGAD